MVVHALAIILLALSYRPTANYLAGGDLEAGWSVEGSLEDGGSAQSAELAGAVFKIDVNPAHSGATALGEPPREFVETPRIEFDERATKAPPDSNSNPVGGNGALDGSAAAHGARDPFVGGGGLEGRGQRGQLAYENGATPQSEAAVEAGLAWLAAHQFKDGSWHFDHTLAGSPCNGYCRNAGKNASSTGATAMALLAFYGAGYTHSKGPYQQQVNRGLYYLGSRMLLTPNGGDMQEGTMYAQGLSAIALCEAYAMSGDENLRPFAEHAIRFILYAQDRKGGGWRYTPGEPGDTTVHGWQLMALKSAALAGIRVPSPAWHSAGAFLDSVQTDGGAAYGYRTPQRLETTTAVGLLCRMYMGWRPEREALARGVSYLDKIGPSKSNMYYNYYATQVMHHFGGEPWQRWNSQMRDYLVATQEGVGHETGSWHFDEQHGNVGGRLYTTAMAVMTLEVYYRYMPLYRDRAVRESF
jgi:hypothetical protein